MSGIGVFEILKVTPEFTAQKLWTYVNERQRWTSAFGQKFFL